MPLCGGRETGDPIRRTDLPKLRSTVGTISAAVAERLTAGQEIAIRRRIHRLDLCVTSCSKPTYLTTGGTYLWFVFWLGVLVIEATIAASPAHVASEKYHNRRLRRTIWWSAPPRAPTPVARGPRDDAQPSSAREVGTQNCPNNNTFTSRATSTRG